MTSKPRFVYVTYIASTPEKVWDALTNGEATKDYWWRHRNASDWKVGSEWRHEDYDNPRTVDIVGTVVESQRPHHLVVTWADAREASDPAKRSRVTYEIEKYEDVVRLTVTHEDLEADSPMLDGITKGWPAVLSSLKSYLETGRPLSIATKRTQGPPE
jgi:uncharacterized protein YndB with AHSA1/START domain